MAKRNEQPRKTLILTGASRGIGHATVKRFSSAGWRVITCSRTAFSEDCPWEAGPEDHVQLDLSDPEGLQTAIRDIRGRLDNGRLDALVNNAAISPKGSAGTRLGALDTDHALWSEVFQVNFFAPMMLARGMVEELTAALCRSERFRQGRLLAALATLLAERYRLQVTEADWDRERITPHLLMNVQIVDDDGKVLAAGRDLRLLKERLAAEHESTSGARETEELSAQGLTEFPARNIDSQPHARPISE